MVSDAAFWQLEGLEARAHGSAVQVVGTLLHPLASSRIAIAAAVGGAFFRDLVDFFEAREVLALRCSGSG